MRLCRPEQDVAFLAKRQLDHAFRREVTKLQHHLLVADGDIVDAQTAALDLAPRLAIGGDKARLDEQRQDADAGFELVTVGANVSIAPAAASSTVAGDVLDVSDEVFQAIEKLEQSFNYRRQTVVVQTGDGRRLTAEAYAFDSHVQR